jgi:CubicO group peptidase (beta-lactamase class C family)
VDWAGQAIEQASGTLLIDYLRERVLDPLGMIDTGFAIRPELRQRLSGMHVRRSDGSLEPMEYHPDPDPRLFTGGGGLHSTAGDYLTFLRMLLGNGSFNGVRLLQPETVRLMATNQIGDLNAGVLKSNLPASSYDADFFPGMRKGWGLGFLINMEASPTGRSAGSLAWAGLRNTYFWLDPDRGVAGVLLTQSLPFADPAVLRLLGEFEGAVYRYASS